MIPLKRIITYYKPIDIVSSSYLKNIYFKILKTIADEKNIEFPPILYGLQSLESQRDKEIQKSLEKLKEEIQFPIELSLIRGDAFLQGLLTESTKSLEKAIYWFFNYRFNQRHGFLVPASQSMYYSEFFSFISLSRFLGIAFTFIPQFHPIQIIIQWESGKILISKRKIGKGAHKRHFHLLKNEISRFDFINVDIKTTIEGRTEFLSTAERKETVYDFGLKSEVFDFFHWEEEKWKDYLQSFNEWCFLGGNHGLGIGPVLLPEDDNGSFDQFIYDEYGSWGYREHNIGVYQEEMIMYLKKINNQSIQSFLNELRQKIMRIPYIEVCEKADLLCWLNNTQ